MQIYQIDEIYQNDEKIEVQEFQKRIEQDFEWILEPHQVCRNIMKQATLMIDQHIYEDI